MKIISVTQQVKGGEFGNDWSIDNLSLNPKVNIIVGKNSTGKSRLINVISNLSRTIKKGDYQFDLSEDINLICEFQKENGEIFKYSFRLVMLIMDIEVYEKIEVNNKILLDRNPKSTTIYSETLKKYLTIAPPENKLVLHIRRDKIEFPFLEDLANWADKIRFFYFSELQTDYYKRNQSDPSSIIDRLNKKSLENIIEGSKKLGFEIESISWKRFTDRPGNYIVVKEKGFEKHISEFQLSQGMFRSIGLLIFIENLIQNNSVSTLIIDDLGEGLDYERATKLGKLLIEKLENSNIQFIATSNDNFLMNVIDIKYWNVLQRDGNTVRALNYHNSKEIFDEFKLSGMSNFYLFSSDFLTQKQA